MNDTPERLCAACTPRPREELLARLNDYFALGGLFNPEMMEHGKVSALLMDCRTYIHAHE